MEHRCKCDVSTVVSLVAVTFSPCLISCVVKQTSLCNTVYISFFLAKCQRYLTPTTKTLGNSRLGIFYVVLIGIPRRNFYTKPTWLFPDLERPRVGICLTEFCVDLHTAVISFFLASMGSAKCII